MITCKKCGAALLDTAKFCYKCGALTTDQGGAQKPAAPPAGSVPPAYNPSPDPFKNAYSTTPPPAYPGGAPGYSAGTPSYGSAPGNSNPYTTTDPTGPTPTVIIDAPPPVDNRHIEDEARKEKEKKEKVKEEKPPKPKKEKKPPEERVVRKITFELVTKYFWMMYIISGVASIMFMAVAGMYMLALSGPMSVTFGVLAIVDSVFFFIVGLIKKILSTQAPEEEREKNYLINNVCFALALMIPVFVIIGSISVFIFPIP